MYYVILLRTMDTLISGSGVAISAFEDNDEGYHAEDKELDVIDTDEINEISDLKQDQDGNDEENEDGKKKTPVWKKPQKKKQAKKQDKNAGKQKQKPKQKPKPNEAAQGDNVQSAQVRWDNFFKKFKCETIFL